MQEYFNLEKINDEIMNDALQVINSAEYDFRDQLYSIANDIIANHSNTKVIFLGGPSSAGKTTSSKLLQEILEKKGKKVLAIEMDNFFKEYSERKMLPDGSIDYDSLDAVNLQLINKCFTALFKNGNAMFPIFDFYTGESILNKKEYCIDRDTIIIFEGIHALNPILINNVSTTDTIKIYINNEKGYSGFGYTIPARSFRLIRRMVRDFERRGKSYQETLDIWHNICEAEDLYISPYKSNADYIINTSHKYEINLFKKEIEKALKNNLLSCCELPWLGVFCKVVNLDRNLLPKTTLMKEFIEI